MSSISIIAIQGNYLDRVQDLFNPLQYIDVEKDKKFSTWTESITYLEGNYFEYTENNIALRGLCFSNGWTIIIDPEMVDALDAYAMEGISKNLKTTVLTFLIETTSGTFGFSKYEKITQREFLCTDGVIAENKGIPLKEEEGSSMDTNIFADDIFQIAYNFGIDLDFANCNPDIIVKELKSNA